ncbi:prolipoprotein diacylglyceryl transferase [Paenibacillus sp. F411]|uniref:prolipoprotein diacylglyceryl transferase n=1 Tax=Paenibacillus sp. F411 TaxID=2820239 RepID=UPI001AB0100A|nr:prolipoprotein diacylglyceryl transferase [Paenibacillus sp. F411]MBO2946217.1 prolipoprotein diacylglyceryl transferase [Paenibacillus sp. F411]
MSLLINPIAFQIGSLPVHWYGIILGLGALAGLLLAIREGKRFGIPQEFFMDLLLLGVPSAIVAARIYYVAFKWEDYKDNIWDAFKIWEGGIAIYGALIGAIICAVIYVRRQGYSFWRIADICAPSLLIGQAIGRWGNFVNQEAYGGPVEESFLRNTLHLPDFIVDQMNVKGVFHHPTFLYESLWNFVGIALLLVLRRQKFLRAGELFISYFIWYSIGRFFIEALRTDSLAFQGSAGLASFLNSLWSPMTWMGFEQGYLDPVYGNVRISQLLALLIIIAAIALIVIRRTTGKASARYMDPIVSTKNAGAPTPEADLNRSRRKEELSEQRSTSTPETQKPQARQTDSVVDSPDDKEK